MKLRTLLAACILACTANTALASTITVGGQDYDIDIVNGTFEERETALTSQVWWGNETLAQEFTLAFGAPATFFAFETQMFDFGDGMVTAFSGTRFIPSNPPLCIAFGFGCTDDTVTDLTPADEPNVSFAVVAPPTVSQVPLPAGGLLLVSGLAGFAALKRRKQQNA